LAVTKLYLQTFLASAFSLEGSNTVLPLMFVNWTIKTTGVCQNAFSESKQRNQISYWKLFSFLDVTPFCLLED